MSRKHYQRIGSKLVLIEQPEQPAATETKPAKAKAKPATAETEPVNQPDNEALENDSSST